MEFEFTQAYVNGIPLIFVILGFVTFLAKMGLSGRGLLLSSLLTGLVLGVLYQLSALGFPPPESALQSYFGMFIYGLALGLVASGVYETGKRIAEGKSWTKP